MRSPPFRPALFATALTIGGILVLWAISESTYEQAAEPDGSGKLVVLVVFDQMRADYLSRWEKLYDKDGFGRMLRDGAWFQNCHYPYAFTLTSPGHTSIVTGCPPSKHGVIGNDWYDREARAIKGSVAATGYRTVPPAMNAKADGFAPINRRQPAVGEQFHKMGNGKAKVVSLSLKAYAAILMASLRATAVYWLNLARGIFVTSSYYEDAPKPWVQEFNRDRPADKYFGKNWTKLRPDLDYALLSGPDDVAAEGIGHKQGRTFPHPTTGGLTKPGEKYYEAVASSPFGNELLLELAMRAIDAEKLGQRDTCDLLCLSFSSNDWIGHCWGPDSQEVLDITLNADLIMKKLLSYLDAKVGKDRYVVVMTADHGVGPIPSLAKEGGRVSPSVLSTQAAGHLQKTFAEDKESLAWVEKSNDTWIYLNHAVLKKAGVTSQQAEESLVDWLKQQRGVQTAYARSRLEKGPFDDDPIGEAVRLSFDTERSGNVAVVVKPYHMIVGVLTDKNYPTFRATHGTPHPYDTNVPLLVFGADVKSGVRQDRVAPLSIAAIIAQAAGVPPPEGAMYPVPEGLFRK